MLEARLTPIDVHAQARAMRAAEVAPSIAEQSADHVAVRVHDVDPHRNLRCELPAAGHPWSSCREGARKFAAVFRELLDWSKVAYPQ